MDINFTRLTKNIQHLSTIGMSTNGITRPAFSKEDMDARSWLISKMEEAGLDVYVDEAANIIGRLSNNHEASIVACGSHIDTVNCGGHLDGTLGVLAGLEAIQTLKENNTPLSHPIDVIAFSDEEGRFGGMLGSRAIAGCLPEQDIETAKDIEGISLSDCLTESGFNPKTVLNAKKTNKTYKAFIELHIEQGPVLEEKQIPIGIVTSITGLFKWNITLKGQANHAGTTPMNMRRDAFQGLASFASQIDHILKSHGGEHTKTTIGKVELFPGSPNVVPGECVFTLETRDGDQNVLKQLRKEYHQALQTAAKEHDLTLDIQDLSDISPTLCDEDIISLIATTAEDLNIQTLHMPSGAAHDAQNMARLTKTAMIFVPSVQGISHSPLEDTKPDDIKTGANLLLNTLYLLAR